MTLIDITFCIFAFFLLLSSLFVITARNAVHSVLFLIFVFFNTAGLFLLLGAEFVAMILVIVYVGAVAVLFLFVVMMLDLDFEGLRKNSMKYAGLATILGLIFFVEVGLLFSGWYLSSDMHAARAAPTPEDVNNTKALGQILYTQYVYAFQAAGMILFVAMIGAIVLTLRTRPGVRKQNTIDQYARRPEDVLEIKSIESGKGV